VSCCEQPTVFSSIVFRHFHPSPPFSSCARERCSKNLVSFFFFFCSAHRYKKTPQQKQTCLVLKKRYVEEIVFHHHPSTLPPFAPLSTYVSHPLRSSDRCYPYGRDEHIQRDDGSIVTMRALTRRRSSWEQLHSNHIILKVALLYQCHSSTGVGQFFSPNRI
jgi:hypothetical protein